MHIHITEFQLIADFDNAVKLACEILKRLDEEQVMSF